MLLRFFSRSNPLTYLALFALLILLRLKLVTRPEFYVIGDQTECYAPLWNTVFGHVAPASLLSVVLAIAVTALCALIVNNTANRYGLVSQQGTTAGLFFVLLAGGLRHSIAFQPAIVYSLFLIWGVDRLFSAMRKDYPYASVAWGFAILTLGSLFWAKGVWLIPFFFVMLFVLRISSLRALAAALVGVGGVAFTAFLVELFMPDPLESGRAFLRAVFDTRALWKIGPFSITYISITLLCLFFGALSLQRHLSELNIQESRRVRMSEWLFFFSIFLMTLPGFSFDLQIIAATGAALFLPAFTSRLRSPRARLLFPLILIAVTFWIIYV